MSEYTPEQRRADQLAVHAALLPLMTATLAEVGLTVREAMALMEAGEPPPERPARDPPRSSGQPADRSHAAPQSLRQ